MKKMLMVLGPTEVEDEILKLGATPQEYMRTEDYSNKLEKIFKNLQYIFQTKKPVLMYASSGTGVMEAAVTNILSKNDTALYVNGGTFGARWGEICKKHSVQTIELKTPFGTSISPIQIENTLKKNKNIKAVFTTLDETSSGALTDIKSIAQIVNNYPNTILVVDCVSGLIVEEFKMDEWGVDIAISSSQKALAIPPGLAFLAISDKALEMAKNANLKTFYFDIFEYIKNYKRNQTPFTPPVSLINQLERRLDLIQKKGLKTVRQEYVENTKLIRIGIKNLGFNVFAQNPANCVTGICTENICDASLIVKIMREKHNIELAPSGGELKTKFFRIGNFGAINKKEIKTMLNALSETLKEVLNQ